MANGSRCGLGRSTVTGVKRCVVVVGVLVTILTGCGGQRAAAPPKLAVAVQPVAVSRSVQFDQAFATLAKTLPLCTGDAVTNCRYGDAAHTEASVQSSTATIYFETRNGIVTDLEVYPVAH